MAEIITFGIIFASITVTGLMSEKLEISPILFEILIGLVFGPNVLGIVELDETMKFLQELGLIMLLFLAGLNLNLTNPRERFKEMIILSTPSFLSGIIFYSILRLLGWFTSIETLVIAIILATTSKSLTLSLLKDKLDTEGLYDTAVMSNIFKDIFLITVASFILEILIFDGRYEELVISISLEVIILVLFVIIIVYLTQKISLYWFSRRYDKSQKHEWKIKFIFGVLGLLMIIASVVNIELALAAYLAGIFVQKSSKPNIEDLNKIRGVGYGFLIPIFFFVVGMQTDPAVLLNASSIGRITVILLLIIILKIALGIVVLSYFLDSSKKDKIVTTLVYTTVSESIGFAILNLADTAGVIQNETFAIFAFILVSVQLLVIFIVELGNIYLVKNMGMSQEMIEKDQSSEE